MARSSKNSALAFDALTVEGALIAPAMLGEIASSTASGQSEADYGVPKGLSLRDEIPRYFRMAQALFADFARAETPNQAGTVDFVEKLLSKVFGFADVRRTGSRTLNDRLYPVTLEALGERVPIIIVAPNGGLDAPTTALPTGGRRASAASAVQDWLNATDFTLWGIATNGEKLRLVRDNASLTRPAYIEADLKRIFEAELLADFGALWLLLHASRFGKPDTPASDCWLEHWRDAGAKAGVAARERLRDGVEAALLALGQGYLEHPGNSALRERLASGALPLPDYFGQLLRLVYRLIFLFAAEDRNLLHPRNAPAAARRLYAQGYSVGHLRDHAVRRTAWDGHHDRWEGLLVAFAALSRGEPKLGLPALDGLFANGGLPDLEEAKLANRRLMEAIYRLAWLKDTAGLTPVNWRDMETEELGSVYESLLELSPTIKDGQFGFAGAAEGRGNTRKTTGSYYTPDTLVQTLLESALDPVLERVEAEAAGRDLGSALLTVTVIDPACGSGHFLLAAARRIATRVARARAGGVASAEDYRHALRDVARSCIHGVDRNPMAVELAKVALWIETVEPGKPLGFLDANIRCGDALLGVFDLKSLDAGIPDAAYTPLTGDDKATANGLKRLNRSERSAGLLKRAIRLDTLAAERHGFMEMDEEDVAALDRRRIAFEKLMCSPDRWALKQACDAYVAAFLLPKPAQPSPQAKPLVPTTRNVWEALDRRPAQGQLAAAVDVVTEGARAFHWPLEFPDVMAAGGFDIVLGNPPWERIKLQEQEFFAARDPEIATAPNAAARRHLIAALAQAELGTPERALYDDFEGAKRTAEASSAFARVPGEEGGRFPLTGRGDVNTYALFAELFSRLSSPRGRAGIIAPTGLITDFTTSTFFSTLVANQRLVRSLAFDNQLRIFPAIHPDTPFTLLTIGHETRNAEFGAYLLTIEHVDDARRRYSLSAEQIARINPNTKTAPVFRSRADAELTAKIYDRVPVLIAEGAGAAGNPWGLSFMTMFHMSNDSGLFRTPAQLEQQAFVRNGPNWVSGSGCYVPLYEAKMIHQFDHRWATYDGADSRDATLEEKRDPMFEPVPRYWVPDYEIADRLAARNWTRDWLMGWRDITNATNERTVITTSFPLVGVGNKIPLMFPAATHSAQLVAALIANFSALAHDYAARQKIGGTTLNFFLLFQLPILPPTAYTSADLAFIVPRVLKLAYTSHAMAPFARDLGYDGPPFAWDEDLRAQLRAELDAWYARAYGLSRDELRYVLDPADVMGTDYPTETFRVLKTNEIRRYGEYRTARLVLAAWDAQAAQPLAAE